jgi:integrase
MTRDACVGSKLGRTQMYARSPMWLGSDKLSDGAARGIRTPDPLITNENLSGSYDQANMALAPRFFYFVGGSSCRLLSRTIWTYPHFAYRCLPHAYRKQGAIMGNAKITKRTVDALQCSPGKDRTFVWDTDIRGFGVGAFKSGTKVYVVQYRKDGRSRRLALGEHGRLTPEGARALAKKALGAVEGGADPIAERGEARAVRTFREVADDFLRLHTKTKRKGRTHEEYERLLKLHVYPAIGAKRVVDVTRADVAKMHGAMDKKPIIANKSVAVISSVWGWAARRHEVSAIENPAKGIDRYEEKKRERFLTVEELARLGDTLREAETVGLSIEGRRAFLDAHSAAAIRLLILTGARLREILGLQWSQVDSERGMAFLPTSKTGKKTIYLSAAALAVLASIPRAKDSLYVIAGKEGAQRADLKRPWASVTKAAKLEGLRIHDLRHSFASIGAGASFGLPIIGKLLGHSQPATTARYAHLDADPMRRAVDTIGATISAAMDRAPQGEKASNVVPIDERRA